MIGESLPLQKILKVWEKFQKNTPHKYREGYSRKSYACVEGKMCTWVDISIKRMQFNPNLQKSIKDAYYN